MSLQEQLTNKELGELSTIVEMPFPSHRYGSKCVVSDDEDEQKEEGEDACDVLHKMRRITQESAKSIINNSSNLISWRLNKRKVIVDDSDDLNDKEPVEQCDILTMFSTSCSNLSSSRANSAFSGQEEHFSVSEYKIADYFTTAPLELTLQQIISDAKSGIPSLNEEKARQHKILKQRQQKNIKNTQSSEQINAITDDQAPSKDPKLVKERLVSRINGNTFNSRKQHTKKWSDEETLRFFKGLQVFGTDFSLIQKLFPERTRAQIKNKFRKEEKENNQIVEESIMLNSKRRYNKIQAKLTVEKEKHESITPETEVGERIELLKQERKRRLYSFESVDSADIEVAEDVNEIFKRENIPSLLI